MQTDSKLQESISKRWRERILPQYLRKMSQADAAKQYYFDHCQDLSKRKLQALAVFAIQEGKEVFSNLFYEKYLEYGTKNSGKTASVKEIPVITDLPSVILSDYKEMISAVLSFKAVPKIIECDATYLSSIDAGTLVGSIPNHSWVNLIKTLPSNAKIRTVLAQTRPFQICDTSIPKRWITSSFSVIGIEAEKFAHSTMTKQVLSVLKRSGSGLSQSKYERNQICFY